MARGFVPLPPYVEDSKVAKVRKLAMKAPIGEKRLSSCKGPSVPSSLSDAPALNSALAIDCIHLCPKPHAASQWLSGFLSAAQIDSPCARSNIRLARGYEG